jgi:hypothetical protein
VSVETEELKEKLAHCRLVLSSKVSELVDVVGEFARGAILLGQPLMLTLVQSRHDRGLSKLEKGDY